MLLQITLCLVMTNKKPTKLIIMINLIRKMQKTIE